MSHILSTTVQRRILAPLPPWQHWGAPRLASATCTNNTSTNTERNRPIEYRSKMQVAPAFLIKRTAAGTTRHPRLIWTKGREWALILLVATNALIFTSACDRTNPNAPTAIQDAPKPAPAVLTATIIPICGPGTTPSLHNVPVTFEGEETGPIYYVCATQPREYMDADGKNRTWEVDHYISRVPCPTTPVS